jgi:hypothetical protein
MKNNQKTENRKQKIYVSLTTISSRIKKLVKTIDSILKQTAKPDEIRVYLSKKPYLFDEGINEEQIPPKLKQYNKEGKIKIIYTENTGPYRKLLPILKEKWNKKCIIITADDDVIYPLDWIERLLEESEEFPNSIIAHRCRDMKIEGKKIAPYNSWELISLKSYIKDENSINSKRVFPTGRNGVLYKPSFFKEIIFDKMFLKLCPYNDDIWFKIISLVSGTNNQVIFSDEWHFGFANNKADKTKNLNEINLNKKNKMNNDAQLKKVITYLKENYRINVYNLLGTEKKLKINTPKYPKKFPGTFWGITTFFNPAGYKNKYENYKLFRENSKRQGLNLLAVELAFEDKPFELKKEDAEILIQIRGNKDNIMWQKEALLNISLKNLPKNCDKIAWLDCDITFKNNNWIKETSKLLEKYKVVQPYSLAVYAGKNKDIEKINVNKIKFGIHAENRKRFSKVFTLIEKNDNSGHPGFAWAARREIFDKIGFYDRLILGSADAIMSDSFYCSAINIPLDLKYGEMSKDLTKWCKECFKIVRGDISYCKGTIIHLWHGRYKNRSYIERRFILKDNNFNPETDIKRNNSGIWSWSSKAPKKLIQDTKSYFFARNEENILSLKSIYYQAYFLKELLKNKNFIQSLDIKKDILLGNLGIHIKKQSPKIYKYLVERKPNWAKSRNK